MKASRYILVFDSVRKLLEDGNIESLTISNIADCCQLHPSTVSYYFNGKNDMLMRFHAYMFDMRISSLPAYYRYVPTTKNDAVRSLLDIIDLELFSIETQPLAYRKILNYLYGGMNTQPVIKYYLEEKQVEYVNLLYRTFATYCDAGIARPEELDKGLNAIILTSAGFSYLSNLHTLANEPVHWPHSFSRAVSPLSSGMSSERVRIMKLMLKKDYHSLLGNYIQHD